MVTLLTDQGERTVAGARRGRAAVAHAIRPGSRDGLGAAAGRVLPWRGLRPLPAGRESELVRDGRVEVGASGATWARRSHTARRATSGCWARERATARAALRSLQAPDFRLPDPSGAMPLLVRAARQEGAARLLGVLVRVPPRPARVAGALRELRALNFTVVAVAMDSRPADPLPWIEAARPSYLTLIDRDHRLAELYNMVNVPEAVWIDEDGRIVRPPEPAGSYEGFRRMNRETKEMPEEVARLTAQTKAAYVDAIRDWVRNGLRSEHALDPRRASARLKAPDENVARAHVAFRLGQHLIRAGRPEEGRRAGCRRRAGCTPTPGASGASRRGVNDTGLASLPDFWERVDALGDKRYYPPSR